MDVVSGGELAIARAVEFPPENIYFHGNNKSPDELREAMDYGVGRIVVDNFTELDLLDRMANTEGKRQRILLRISPGVDPHTHAHTTTGTLDSKFGFPLDTGQADQAMKQAIEAQGLDLIGLHFHLGSPVFEMDPYVQAVEAVVNLAKSYANHGFDFKEFSPGGGFAIAYTLDDEPPTPAAYAKTITEVVQRTCSESGLDVPRLVVEPGRALIGRAGVALYTVGATKDIPDIRRYIAVDGGMGDNIRPALYDARYEAVVANKMGHQATQLVTIAGKYCESGDILVRDVMLPPTEFGDLIAIPAVGAYCLSMASTYNMNPRPPVVLVNSGQSRLLRRRETYEDMMTLDL
jgi:diaminopimelate decarboxylase